MSEALAASRLPDWPYGMSIEEAAAFCGISRNTLLRLVEEGAAPKPVAISKGRKIWLRPSLQEWLDRLAGRIANERADEDEWSKPRGKFGTALRVKVPGKR